MASLPLVIDPTSGMPVEANVVGTFAGSVSENTVDEHGERPYFEAAPAAIQPYEDGSFSALSEPQEFALPPEVLKLLAPGTNPFASILPYVPSPAGAPAGSPSVVPTAPSMGAPAPAGSGGLLPAVGGLPTPDVMIPLPQVLIQLPPPGAGDPWTAIPDWDRMPLGGIFFHPIRNRQPSGIRIGTLPMIVFGEEDF